MNLKQKQIKIGDYGALIALVALALVLSIISSDFRDVGNIISLLRQSSINGLIAFGMTLVILTGGIDLSVGSTLALTVCTTAKLITMGIPSPFAMAIGLVLGVALGTINGVMIAKGKLQPFIATLITMISYSALALIITNGKPISNLVGDNQMSNDFLSFVGKGSLFGIPTPIITFAIAFAVLYFLLHNTTFGRKIYSTGSNASAAAISGINTVHTKLTVYAASGFFAALSGMILLSRLSSAQPTLGEGYELDAIAAVALGGTSLSGGRGKIFGTLVGVLIIAMLNNGLNIINVSSHYQDLIKGVVILIAVLSDIKKEQ